MDHLNNRSKCKPQGGPIMQRSMVAGLSPQALVVLNRYLEGEQCNLSSSSSSSNKKKEKHLNPIREEKMSLQLLHLTFWT